MVRAHRKMTEQEKVLEIFWIFENILNCREVIEIKCRHLIASFPTVNLTQGNEATVAEVLQRKELLPPYGWCFSVVFVFMYLYLCI